MALSSALLESSGELALLQAVNGRRHQPATLSFAHLLFEAWPKTKSSHACSSDGRGCKCTQGSPEGTASCCNSSNPSQPGSCGS